MDALARDRMLALAGIVTPRGAVGTEERGHPHPGQHYKHGWIPIEGEVDLLSGDAAHRAAPLALIENKKDPLLGKVRSKPGPGMTVPEARSLASYRERGFVDTNRKLRKGQGEMPTTGPAANMVTNIDSAMARSPLARAITATRGIGNGGATFGDLWHGDLTGTRFTDHGFVSVTTDGSIADEFAHRPGVPREGGALVTLSVPAGTSGISLGGREHESEILLDRGLTFDIVSDSGPGPNRQIHMVVVAP